MSFTNDNALQLNQLPTSVEFADPVKDSRTFIEVLTMNVKRTADTVNTKEAALYLLQELGNFKQWFVSNDPLSTRNVYRKVFDLILLNGGNIAGGATVSFPHGITNLMESVLIYVACRTTEPKYFTQMGLANVWMDATNINFVNPSASPLTQADFVAEYLKQS